MHIVPSIQTFYVRTLGAIQITAFIAAVFFAPWTFGQEMSLKQKVGQLFVWTYPGQGLTPRSRDLYENFQPGALIVFSANITSTEQVGRMNAELQDLAAKKMKAPFFLMIDQEGGAVTRLRTSVPLPSALALGNMHDDGFVQKFGKATADLLHSLGFNVNLAPVLDIADSARDSFIGNRAFGNDPDQVTSTALAYSEGLHEGAMMPTAKHFPGYGGLTQDTHRSLVRKMSTADELEERDLVPFEEYAQTDYPRAIMMAHLSLPKIDPSGAPATYSKTLIQTYLRGKLKYNGLIITDDLEMAGASIASDIGERAVRAFLAGDDMLLVAGKPSDQREAFEAMLNAVKKGRVSQARLDESVKRILAYKSSLGIKPFRYDGKQVRALSTKMDDLSRQVLKKNFQLSLKGQLDRWPTVNAQTKTLVLSSDRGFFRLFAKDFKGRKSFYHLSPRTLESSRKMMQGYDLVVFYASGIQTAHWLATLDAQTRAKILVVNSNNSGEVEAQNSFLSVLNINTISSESGEALSHALNGNSAGRLPASVNAK